MPKISKEGGDSAVTNAAAELPEGVPYAATVHRADESAEAKDVTPKPKPKARVDKNEAKNDDDEKPAPVKVEDKDEKPAPARPSGPAHPHTRAK